MKKRSGLASFDFTSRTQDSHTSIDVSSISSTKDDEFQSVHLLSEMDLYFSTGSRKEGLNAYEVQLKQSKYGKNAIRRKEGVPLWRKFLDNFTHLMALLLWSAAAIGIFANLPELAVSISMVNVINGLFSFWQEFKAEKATEALNNLLPSFMRGKSLMNESNNYLVIRENGHNVKILSEELVPGDIIVLEEGDRISADAILIESNDVSMDQSALTGESNPVIKLTWDEMTGAGGVPGSSTVKYDDVTSRSLNSPSVSKMEAPNIIFAGTSVLSGNGKAVVYATGMRTEIGKIAHLTQSFSEQLSPIQKEMKRITKVISVLATSMGVFLFLAAFFFANVGLAESFIFAMGMVVAFVPEGVVPLVTLTLAMGTQRMAKHNALIKKLSSVETLGCTSVICSDKTGTLTQNEMTACKHIVNVTGSGYDPHGSIQMMEDSSQLENATRPPTDLEELLIGASLCNNASIVPPTHAAKWKVVGDPTEGALVVLAMKGGVNIPLKSSQLPRTKEFPFDSKRKRMSSVHVIQDALLVFSKGAPKEMLDLCEFYRAQGHDAPLNEDLRGIVLRVNDEFSLCGLRVLLIATRTLPTDSPMTVKGVEQKLTLLGLVALQDPARVGVPEAVEKCHRAGIRVVMITGDYGLTAKSIALDIGIIKNRSSRVITGVEMDSMDDETLKSYMHEEVIFARVSPEHKYRVVAAFQQLGHIVAVTGDGTNDAPALKKADIGISMGISGTEVAKEASDMLLLDDNFASIVHAVEEGRTVFANIRKFIGYIFASNTAEAVPYILFIFSRGKIPLALTIMQVLFVDLGTDMIPALALGTEGPEEGIMDRPPRNLGDHVITTSLLLRSLVFMGSLQSIAAMSAFYFQFWMHGISPSQIFNSWSHFPGSLELYESATTLALSAIVFCQVGNLFATRSEHTSFFSTPLFNNMLLWFGVAFELILLMAIIYIPSFQRIFNTYPFDHWDTDGLLLLSCIPLLLFAEECRKWILRRKKATMNESLDRREPLPTVFHDHRLKKDHLYDLLVHNI